MTSFKDIQTLLPLFHDDGLIDDDEFLLLYELYSSTNPDFPYHIYTLHLTLTNSMNLNGWPNLDLEMGYCGS